MVSVTERTLTKKDGECDQSHTPLSLLLPHTEWGILIQPMPDGGDLDLDLYHLADKIGGNHFIDLEAIALSLVSKRPIGQRANRNTVHR